MLLRLCNATASVCKCVHLSAIVCNVAASKCCHCCSIICCYDYAVPLPLHVAASLCKYVYVSVIVCNVATSKCHGIAMLLSPHVATSVSKCVYNYVCTRLTDKDDGQMKE